MTEISVASSNMASCFKEGMIIGLQKREGCPSP